MEPKIYNTSAIEQYTFGKSDAKNTRADLGTLHVRPITETSQAHSKEYRSSQIDYGKEEK